MLNARSMSTTTHSLRSACRRCRPHAFQTYGQLSRRPRTAWFSTSQSDDLEDPTPQRPHSKLIILEPPRKQRPPEHTFYPPLDPTATLGFEPLEQAKTLLTYEAKAELDITRVNISLLRPRQPRVSEQRFSQLAEQLFKSFTLTQLRSYYEFCRTEMGKEGQLLPRIRSTTPKAKLVPLILTKVWKIEKTEEIAERQDVLVNKDVECSKQDIFFLIGDDGQILREWANQFGARITVDVQNSNLQIQASQVSIEEIEARMSVLLHEVKEEELDLSAILRVGTFDWTLVPAISRTTSTFIEKLDDNRVRLSALKQERIDNARRLLFTSVPLSIRTESSLLYEPPAGDSVKGGLFPITEAVALPWIYRRQEWSRWRYITPVNTFSEDSEARLLSLSSSEVSSVLENQAASRLEPPPTYVGRLRAKVSHEAVFGHLLHRYNSAEGLVARGLREFIEEKDASRAFCHTFPGSPFFNKFVESLPGPKVDFVYDESFRLSFLPSPWQHQDNFEKYPPVHVVMPINATSDKSGKPTIYALQSRSVADVMLPGEYCDIRFARTRTVQMGMVSDVTVDHGVQIREWQRFLSESNLDPVKDHRLRASPNLRLYIPSWLVEPDVKHESEPVDYTFAGMQYRRTTSASIGAIKYSRTEVDGGATGGRSTELKLSRTGTKPERMEQEFMGLFRRALYGVTSLREWMAK